VDDHTRNGFFTAVIYAGVLVAAWLGDKFFSLFRNKNHKEKE